MSLSKVGPVPVSKTVNRFTGSLARIPGFFESFVVGLEKLYGISLPRPRFEGPEQIKKFCTGLIERDGKHLWIDACSRLSAQSRFGIAHSLFLFRKVIPKEKPRLDEYLEKMSSVQEDPDPDFVNFALKLVRKLFRPGWDRSYQDACLSCSLPVSAAAEGGRRNGGCRGLQKMAWENRSEFCEYVLKSTVSAARGASRVQAIETGGKWRIISIPPLVDNALRPLHKAMYSHLSRYDWLLRGDAKSSRFKDFRPVPGEIFVSGDYESATDNLNSTLQKLILTELLERSWSIPEGIKDHVLQTYQSTLVSESGQSFVQRRGQLMGQLTSFPMLCLVNYITFRYAVRRDGVPVRINGDDIVFRSTPEEYKTWERLVAKGGLTLSLGKTMVHPRAFTLNSTPFWGSPSGGRVVGFLRPSALFPGDKLTKQIDSMRDRFFSSCSGYGRRRRWIVRSMFLDLNQKAIHASRRSVSRGLGLAVDREMLQVNNLWQRELFYLEQVMERPLPCLNSELVVPDGWKQVSSSWMSSEMIEDWRKKWSTAVVDHAWLNPYNPSDFTEDALMHRVREGCSPFGLGTLIGAKVRRMLKLSRAAAWKWVFMRLNPSFFGRVQREKGKRVWVEVDLLAARSQVEFLLQSI